MELRDIQLYKLEVLKDIKKLCEKHNITYCLTYGTLLGAIRHKGFIPWDDDIDIQMPLKDYKKFLRICKTDLPEKYFLQNYKTDPAFPMLYSQLRVNGTTSMPVKSAGLNIHWGICIDIFPTVKFYESKIGYVMQKKLVVLCSSLLSVDNIKANNISCEGKQKVINHIPRNIRHLLTDILMSIVFSNKKKNCPCKGLASIYLRPYGYVSDWDNLTVGSFEGESFPIPSNYDTILTQMYKDYMKLPPIEKQGGHEIQLGEQIVDLSKDYKEYKKELGLDQFSAKL